MDESMVQVKPWGSFINEDEGTLKKSTMDVACLMIRTSCQQIIDEFIDVIVNGDIYHLRILEDSYGSMCIMIPRKNGNEGRDSSVESEEDEEEEVRRMWTEGDIEERESEVGETLALKPASNVNIVQVNSSGLNLGSNNDKEEGGKFQKSVEGVDDNALLLAHFDESKVKETVWSCDGNKSPGPDGFNLHFFKVCWAIVKKDLMNFLAEFHEKAALPKVVTASFLTLIPKKDHPQDLFDYRPFCLIGSLYKILSKILANCLKKVLGKLISSCQSKRQILDGVLVLNEVIDLAKRRKDNCLLFKVDFERAYDTVSWGFLEL
ncbi:hypothetical protein TSUD_411700 [Trifolium subterraneum]|uniref:Reverse transcriptase domain-containing protein n=1 Tax=Trifolium subterraneum TaxID=3900 RepID=A0A2Z6PK90_TRISU|nr:hypothetical protein TSUD_411700 [Trifolium subterraneum]